MRTTNKREEVYEFLQSYLSEYGYAPTVREICAAAGLSSPATAHYHLQQLAKEGRIYLGASKRNAISLSSPPNRGRVPLVGVVAAGQPILAIENIEGYLPWDDDDDCFALRIRGNSMIDAGILPGDKIIVRQQPTADHGDIVVALLGDEATVKRLSIESDGIWLLPENSAYDPIDGNNAIILGKVKGLIREF